LKLFQKKEEEEGVEGGGEEDVEEEEGGEGEEYLEEMACRSFKKVENFPSLKKKKTASRSKEKWVGWYLWTVGW
jgi:hypothetical protein